MTKGEVGEVAGAVSYTPLGVRIRTSEFILSHWKTLRYSGVIVFMF